MKNLIFIFLSVFSFFSFLSCSKNNDNTTTQQTNNLVDTWKLVKFEAGFGPTLNYNGEIVWSINSNNTINVSIANGTQLYDSLPLKLAGNYTYTSTTNTITSNQEGFKFEINNDVLIITDALGQSADGRRLTFNKLE